MCFNVYVENFTPNSCHKSSAHTATAPSEAPAPAPAPDHHLTVLHTDIHKLKIPTPRGAGRRGVRLGGPAAAPAALFDYSTSCGGDAALAMAAADVAVTCLQREGRGRAPGRAAPARGGRRDAVLRSHARAVEDAAAPRFCRAAAPSPRRRLAVVAPPPECRPHAAVRLRAAAPLLDPKYTPIRSTFTTFLIPQHLARRTRTYRSTTAGPAGQE